MTETKKEILRDFKREQKVLGNAVADFNDSTTIRRVISRDMVGGAAQYQPLDQSDAFPAGWGIIPATAKRFSIVNEKDLVTPELPGSWVLTFRGEAGAGGIPPLNNANNVIAKITFGVGESQVVEVDAWNNTISIPSDRVNVLAGQAGFGIDWLGAAGWDGVPENFTLSISAQRTSSPPVNSEPTRSYPWATPQTVAQNILVPIPPFATAWTITSQSQIAAGELPFTNTFLATDALYDSQGIAFTPTTLDQPIDEVVASMGRTLCFRKVPPGAQYLSFESTRGFDQGLVIFKIGL